jgi:phosphoglycolate phosphatase
MIKGILFDKDGTLIPFTEVWHPVMRRVFISFEQECGIKKVVVDKMKEATGYLEEGFAKESMIQYCSTTELIEVWMTILAAHQETDKATKEMLHRIIEREAFHPSLVIPSLVGVKKLLKYLKKKEYKLGVATADTKKSTLHSLEKAGILGFFDFIGCDEVGVKSKPHADMGLSFCKRYNLKPSEVLMVGDSVTDMEFARRLGANFIGLKTDYNQYLEFVEQDKIIVERIFDIISICEL